MSFRAKRGICIWGRECACTPQLQIPRFARDDRCLQVDRIYAIAARAESPELAATGGCRAASQLSASSIMSSVGAPARTRVQYAHQRALRIAIVDMESVHFVLPST